MAIEVRWWDEKQDCLLIDYDAMWTLDEFKNGIDAVYGAIESVTS